MIIEVVEAVVIPAEFAVCSPDVFYLPVVERIGVIDVPIYLVGPFVAV